MAKKRTFSIHNPAAGIDRSGEFQQQAPYTTIDALNFRPTDVKTGRHRPALRPRLVAFGSFVSGPGAPIRNLSAIYAATGQTLDRALLCIANGQLYRYIAGVWTAVSGGTGFSTSRYICSADLFGKLYIADGNKCRIFDSSDGSMSLMAAAVDKGDEPEDCTLVSTFFERIVLAGDPANPNRINFSRAGDDTDWLYGLTDAGAAFASVDVNDKITALLYHDRECLLIGASTSTHVLRGDPMDGGSFARLSPEWGPLMQTSWCKIGDGRSAILGRNGLSFMAPGCGDELVPYSRRKIPDSLMGIDGSTYETFLAYDDRFNGLYICLTGASSREAWWLDLDLGGFWPDEYTANEQPRSMLRVDSLDGADVSGTLFGGVSGLIRRADRSNASNTIASGKLFYGPIRISPTPFHRGRVESIAFKFSHNTTDTTGVIKIFAAQTCEDAYAAALADDVTRRAQYTVQQAMDNQLFYPGVGGHAMVITLAMGDGTKHVSLEEITPTVEDAGEQE